MEGLIFSLHSMGIPRPVFRVQGLRGEVLVLMVWCVVLTAGSTASEDGPLLGPPTLGALQEDESALMFSPTEDSEDSDGTVTTAHPPPGYMQPKSTLQLFKWGVSPSQVSKSLNFTELLTIDPDPLSTPPLSALEPDVGLKKHPEEPSRLHRDLKLAGPNATKAASFPNPDKKAPDEPPLLPPSNEQDPSKQTYFALTTVLPVGHLDLPRLPDLLIDVEDPSDQASSLDPSLLLEPSSRLIDLDHLRPSREIMQKGDTAQGIYVLQIPPPEYQLVPSYVPYLSPHTTSSSAEPTLVPPENFFPTNTMEVDWGSGDYLETMSFMGSEENDLSLITNLPTDMYDLEDTESYDTSFPARVGMSFSSMHHLTSSPSLKTTAYSSSVRSVAPTSVHPSIHPSLSHPTLLSTPTPTPQVSSPGISDIGWTDTFSLEPTDVLLPDMNSLEYYTIQLTKNDSEEHRGTNITSTSKPVSQNSISSTHIMATRTASVNSSHMRTASAGVEDQPSDDATWMEEAFADMSGSEPLNTTTAETTEVMHLNVSAPLLEPSAVPTLSMDLFSSPWGATAQVSSAHNPMATSMVGLDNSSVLVYVQPGATSSETDIQWYVSPSVKETALLSTSLVTSVVTASVAFTPAPGQTEMPSNVPSSTAEPATNASTVPPVSVMADQGIDTDTPVTSVANNIQTTLSSIDHPATTTTIAPIITEASTHAAQPTTHTTLPLTTSKRPITTVGRQYVCDITKPVYFVKVGFPTGATVGYAKSQIRDVLKTEFNKSIELQVAKNPPEFVFRAVSGHVVYTAISVINALRQSGGRSLSASHYWKVPDHQYQVLSVLQFVPSHIDVRICNFSERIEKGLTMAYAEVRRRSQESTNFTMHIINITMNWPRSQQREPVDVTFAVRGSAGFLKGSEVSNHLRLLNMVEFSYYLGFPVLQIAEPFQYPELNTTHLLRSSWVRTVLLGVLDQRVDERTFQAKMERCVALLLEEVLGGTRRTKRATTVANHSVQIVSTTRLVGADQPLEMVYFVEGPRGQRLPAITTANTLNRLDVQRAAIVLGYRVQGILATPVEKVAGYPPGDTENTSMWIIIGVVVPLGVVVIIISLLYWKLCRTDKLEFQPDAMTTVQQRQKVQTPSVKGFDFAKLHLGQHSKDDIMVIQEPGTSGPPPSNPSLKEAAAPSETADAPTLKSKGNSISSTKVSHSTRRRGRISPSDADSMASAGSMDHEREAAQDHLRDMATPPESKQARKIPINVLNGKNRIGPPPMNGHDEQLSSASIFDHVDRTSRSADGTRRLTNKIQLIAMQPMVVPHQHHRGPAVNGVNGGVPDAHVVFNKEIQVALRHKSEIERHRNKIRLRAKRKGHYDFPAMDDLVDNGLTPDPQERIYRKAQMQIEKILDPDLHMPSLFMEPKKSGRGKRSPKQKKKQQLNGSLTDADKDRLISNDSDGTYRKYPGVNNVAYVSDPDQALDSGTPSPNDDVFMGPNSPPSGHAPPPPPYLPPQPSIEEARQQMHSLLDDAFALVSPTSQGSTAGITLPGVSSNPPSSGARPWGSSYPPLSSFCPRYGDLGLAPPLVSGLLHRQDMGSSYLSSGDQGQVEQLSPENLYSTRGLYTEDMPSSARPRPVGGSTGAHLHQLTQVGVGSRDNGAYPMGGQTGWGPYADEDFRPSRDPMPSRGVLREPSAPPAHLDNHSYPSDESLSPPNHSSASLIKAIREELLRLSQKQQAVPSYHS